MEDQKKDPLQNPKWKEIWEEALESQEQGNSKSREMHEKKSAETDDFFRRLIENMNARIRREIIWIVVMALVFYVSMVTAVSMGNRLGSHHQEFFIGGQDWYMLAIFLAAAGFVVFPILVLWFIGVRVYDHFFAQKKIGFTWSLFFLAIVIALVGVAFGSFLGGMFF